MKGIPVLVLLAVLGLAAAGCGSGSKVDSATVDSATTPRIATFTSVKGGTVIRCPGGGATATVPDRQTSVNASSYLITARGSRPSGVLRATRSRSGLLTASCTR